MELKSSGHDNDEYAQTVKLYKDQDIETMADIWNRMTADERSWRFVSLSEIEIGSRLCQNDDG